MGKEIEAKFLEVDAKKVRKNIMGVRKNKSIVCDYL
jgi:hypothetical protein